MWAEDDVVKTRMWAGGEEGGRTFNMPSLRDRERELKQRLKNINGKRKRWRRWKRKEETLALVIS